MPESLRPPSSGVKSAGFQAENRSDAQQGRPVRFSILRSPQRRSRDPNWLGKARQCAPHRTPAHSSPPHPAVRSRTMRSRSHCGPGPYLLHSAMQPDTIHRPGKPPSDARYIEHRRIPRPRIRPSEVVRCAADGTEDPVAISCPRCEPDTIHPAAPLTSASRCPKSTDASQISSRKQSPSPPSRCPSLARATQPTKLWTRHRSLVRDSYCACQRADRARPKS